jgi:hypothetical protein
VDFTGIVVRDGDLDLSLTPAEIGIPLFDIIVARQGIDKQEAWLFDTDVDSCLGPLASSFFMDQLIPKEA